MATWVTLGQAFVQELTCSVNCVGRVKKLGCAAHQGQPMFPKSTPRGTVEEQHGTQEEPGDLPRESVSRFSAAQDFVKLTWSSFVQDDQSTAEESASSGSVNHEGSSDDSFAPFHPEDLPRGIQGSDSLLSTEVQTAEVIPAAADELAVAALTDAGAEEPVLEEFVSPAGPPTAEDIAEQAVVAALIAAHSEEPYLHADFVEQTLVEDTAPKAALSQAANVQSNDAAEDAFKECSSEEETGFDEKEDFWCPAVIHDARGLETAPAVSILRRCRVIRHGDLSGQSVLPWQVEASRELYREMGMRKSRSSYVATWLNLQKASLLFVSKVVDEARLLEATADDALMSRLKLILRPVRAKLPFPVKAAQQADTIGAYFGSQSSSLALHDGCDGIRHLCVQVDLYSKWQLRLAMQKIGFSEGNILDMLVVDWPGRAVLSSCRVIVTKELLRQLG